VAQVHAVFWQTSAEGQRLEGKKVNRWQTTVLAALLFGVATMPDASAFGTTITEFVASANGQNTVRGNISFILQNATLQRVLGVTVNVFVQYDLANTQLDANMTINGTRCRPNGYSIDTGEESQYRLIFDCSNVITTEGFYFANLTLTPAIPSRVPQATVVTTDIAYYYSENVIDAFSYWVYGGFQQIYAWTSSIFGWTQRVEPTINATYSIVKGLNATNTNYTPQLDRIEGKLNNLTNIVTMYHVSD
jgi:hypothetical protein